MDGTGDTLPTATRVADPGMRALYRLENRNWIRGRWVEKEGQRRRRYYRLTAQGKKVLAKQRHGWLEFVEAVSLITGVRHARV